MVIKLLQTSALHIIYAKNQSNLNIIWYKYDSVISTLNYWFNKMHYWSHRYMPLTYAPLCDEGGLITLMLANTYDSFLLCLCLSVMSTARLGDLVVRLASKSSCCFCIVNTDYIGILEQIKPLQPIGQAAEFKLSPS